MKRDYLDFTQPYCTASSKKAAGKYRMQRERDLFLIERKQAAKKTGAAPSKQPANYRAKRNAFLASDQWKRLRYDAFLVHGVRCLVCNTGRGAGKQMHVDHIKPMSTHWHLRADPNNLQVLCEDCNLGKGARDETDWR